MNGTHPLTEDLTKLSQDELDKRYTDLMRRYSIARRMNMNQGVMYQLDLMLDGIESEKMRRISEISPDEDPVVIDTDRIRNNKK